MDCDRSFAGSLPELYDRFMVPLIFAEYARDLAARIAARDPANVLELAAGTGALTRELATALAPKAALTATDLNLPMLDYAAAALHGREVVWQPADAQDLPFRDRTFDVVACQFGAMFFPDKIKAYREVRRVLAPHGMFVFSVWGPIAKNGFAEAVTEALALRYPADPPRFMARTPHGYHDQARITADLAAAGFPEPQVTSLDMMSRAASAREVAVAYCQGTPLRNEIEARDPGGLEVATGETAAALERRYGPGPLEAPINAVVVVANVSRA